MKEIYIKNAPKINSHYAPAVLSTDGKCLYISGQLPIDPVSRSMCRGDIREQTLAALMNVERLVQEAGGDRTNIVRTTAYIDNMDNWEPVNAVYADFFGERKPARTILCVKEIHFGLKIEIDAIAEVGR